MLLSMTGFGEGRHEQGPLSVVVEIRTVNNKYFKFSLRSSESYGALDPLVEAAARKRIKRGTVQVQVRIDREHRPEDYRINRDVLDSYRRQLQEMLRDWEVAHAVQIEPLLQLPGVVEDVELALPDIREDWPVIEQAVGKALDQLEAMRAQEGAALESDLVENCRLVLEELDRIEQRLPAAVEEYRERLLGRVNRTLEKHDVTISAADVVREVSLITERSDVSEEIVRLRSHLQQFLATVKRPESSGRKLDFISQEMLREANTIGSKSSDVQIPQHVVGMKAAIERIREQVQNVE